MWWSTWNGRESYRRPMWRGRSNRSRFTSMSADTANTRDLTGRTAVVTGGASGIGRACALRLADLGAHVVIIDISGEGAKETASETGGEFRLADLSDPGVADDL